MLKAGALALALGMAATLAGARAPALAAETASPAGDVEAEIARLDALLRETEAKLVALEAEVESLRRAQAAQSAALAEEARRAEEARKALELRLADLAAALAAAQQSAAPASPKPGAVAHHGYHHYHHGGGSSAQDSLTPLRAFLAGADIPPPDVGGYGVVALQAKPTDATRAKLKMVCEDFLSFFPAAAGSGVPAEEQMLTIWPTESAFAQEADGQNCDFALQHYDLVAAESAMADARRQGARFNGEGPYLIAWAPSGARGVRGDLVLVIDLTRASTQSEIDHAFQYYKEKIVEDPAAWRDGFSLERFRVGLADFADHYGAEILSAVKLIGVQSKE